uniref:Uncharacterized protein n=1 Tax=Quercus lobata TaxID=97700 RepID=A0A7N2MHU9_QUELO
MNGNFGLSGDFHGRFRPVSADSGLFRPYRPYRSPADIGRYGPIRPDFGRVGPSRDPPRGATRDGRAVCGVPPASPRPAASDAGTPAWEPRPCILGDSALNSPLEDDKKPYLCAMAKGTK